jgi:uncharacterized caspase-like protein
MRGEQAASRSHGWRVAAILGGMALAALVAATVNRPQTVSAGMAPRFTRVYILSVGINSYPKESGFFSPKFAEADAAEIPPALADWINFPTKGGWLDEIKTTTLLGPQATTAAIRDALHEIAREADPFDIFFFNFDGMGVCQASHGSYDLAAYDTVLKPDGTVAGGLSARDLGTMLVQIPAANQYVIFDVCGSHRALDDLHSALQPPGQGFALLMRKVHLMAPDGFSIETPKASHGLLTAALLDGMKDALHTGYYSWDRLVGYVTWKLPESSEEDEHLYSLTIYGDAARSPAEEPGRGFEQTSEQAADGQTPNELGHDYALLVGTDHYSNGWPNLNNPIFDIDSLHKELVRDYGFRDDSAHIVELRDPTKHQVVSAIENMYAKKNFGINDRLLVYFAGHGNRTPIEGYVVFGNSKSPRDEDATDSMMAFSELSNDLDKIQVGHILLVMDVCYGGLFDGKTRNGTTRFQSMLGVNSGDSAPPDELIQRALKATSRLYITSGDEDHAVSDGAPGQHSPFSRRFLSVLEQNRTNRPFLDVATLYNGLRSLPREPKAGYFYAGLSEQGGDYIFIPHSEADASKAARPASGY